MGTKFRWASTFRRCSQSVSEKIFLYKRNVQHNLLFYPYLYVLQTKFVVNNVIIINNK